MKLNKLFLSAFVAAAVLVSCSNEKTPGPDPIIDGTEVQTTANFTFDIAKTRAGIDMTDDTGELTTNQIKDIRLLVFKTGASTVCEVNRVFTAATNTGSVLMTSGNKRIFIIANGEGDATIKAALDGVAVNTTTLNEFYTTKSLIKLGDYVSSTNNTFSIASLVSTTSGMIMSNAASAESLYTLVGGITAGQAAGGTPVAGTSSPTNSFLIKVQRAVAKGQVLYKDAATLDTADSKGTLSNLKYSLRNVNRAVYLVQQLSGGDQTPYDPANPGSIMPKAPYYNTFDSFTTAQMNLAATYWPYYYSDFDWEATGGSGSGFKWPATSNMVAVADAATAKAYYFTENTNNRKTVSNYTHAVIQANYTPKANVILSAIDYNIPNHEFRNAVYQTTAGSPNTTLYVTKVGVGSLNAGAMFTNELLARKVAYYLKKGAAMADNAPDATLAEIAAEDLTGFYDTYTNGVCYYKLAFGEGDTQQNTMVYGVRRNNLYRATVNKFAKIGTVSEIGDDEPGTPISENTYVFATIEVIPWRIAGGTYDL